MQAIYGRLNVAKDVQVLLDGNSRTDLEVHINLTEKKRWAGGLKGFMGNDMDTKMGIGGGLVSIFLKFDTFLCLELPSHSLFEIYCIKVTHLR